MDNLNLILPLLRFSSDDDFYMVQIMQRKKENRQVGSNSRVIKTYFVNSKEYLKDRYEEIKAICDATKSRAYFSVNRRSYKKVAFRTLEKMAGVMANGTFDACRKSYDKAAGNGHNEREKRWIVDVDDESQMKDIWKTIDECDPQVQKWVYVIPSKSGVHLISQPFNVQQFKVKFPDVGILKNNATNLYIP